MKTIQLTPSCKDYLWGGEKLRTEYGIQSELHPLSEAWMLSCHPDGPSYLPDGSTFQQYINTHPGCLGTHCEKFSEFPVLAKLIDAKKDLSIQVHPSNEYALEHEHQYGKTEMWYVLEAEPGASLYYGFTHEISKEEFERRIQDNTLTDVLNAVPVHKGDCFFIPSGTLHAIRKGIVVAEIQQNSNVTYRIYDFNRKDADGNTRELHTELAKGAIDYTVLPDYRTKYEQVQDRETELVSCPYFTTSLCDLTAPLTLDYAALDSFVVVICVEGKGMIADDSGNEMPIHQGETVLLPATVKSLRIVPEGKLKMLTSCIK